MQAQHRGPVHMKKFKFFVCDYKGNIIASSNGYYDSFRKLPPEFSVQDVLNEPYFNKTVKKRVPNMREGSMVRVSRLCGWSSRSGGPEYLYIKCVGDAFKIETLREQLNKVSAEIDSINKEIAKLAGPLMDELKDREKVKKSLKEQIKDFEENGE
jgi:hypothetical protein